MSKTCLCVLTIKMSLHFIIIPDCFFLLSSPQFMKRFTVTRPECVTFTVQNNICSLKPIDCNFLYSHAFKAKLHWHFFLLFFFLPNVYALPCLVCCCCLPCMRMNHQKVVESLDSNISTYGKETDSYPFSRKNPPPDKLLDIISEIFQLLML